MVESEFGGGLPWCWVTQWWLVTVMCALEKGVMGDGGQSGKRRKEKKKNEKFLAF